MLMSVVALLILELQFFSSLVCCSFPGHWISGSLRSSQSWKWNKYALHLKGEWQKEDWPFTNTPPTIPLIKPQKMSKRRKPLHSSARKYVLEHVKELFSSSFHRCMQSYSAVNLHQKHTKIKSILTFLWVWVTSESVTPSDKHDKQK